MWWQVARPNVRITKRMKRSREIYENVVSRDKADMSRAISPLRKADDAIVLDNSHMSVEEQMSWFMERYEEALAK